MLHIIIYIYMRIRKTERSLGGLLRFTSSRHIHRPDRTRKRRLHHTKPFVWPFCPLYHSWAHEYEVELLWVRNVTECAQLAECVRRIHTVHTGQVNQHIEEEYAVRGIHIYILYV